MALQDSCAGKEESQNVLVFKLHSSSCSGSLYISNIHSFIIIFIIIAQVIFGVVCLQTFTVIAKYMY